VAGSVLRAVLSRGGKPRGILRKGDIMVEVKDLGRHEEAEVTLAGWVDQLRVHGKVAFIVVRDGTGYVQCVLVRQNLPEEVWEAAVASVDDIGLALIETEAEHGRIRARAGWSIWDLKGHELMVVVRTLDDGRVRVDANAQAVSDDDHVDFGRSGRIVRDYLKALDDRLATSSG